MSFIPDDSRPVVFAAAGLATLIFAAGMGLGAAMGYVDHVVVLQKQAVSRGYATYDDAGEFRWKEQAE